MSNVNPGQYKVAGAERQGEDVLVALEKAKLTQQRARLRRAAPEAPEISEDKMPEKETLERAEKDAEEGKSPSTQALARQGRSSARRRSASERSSAARRAAATRRSRAR